MRQRSDYYNIPGSSEMSNVAQPDSISFMATRRYMSLFEATEPHKCQPTRLVTEDRLWQLDSQSNSTRAKAPNDSQCPGFLSPWGATSIVTCWHQEWLAPTQRGYRCAWEACRHPITSFKSLFGGARGLIIPCCSSDALEHRPGGLLGKCLRICVQEVSQFSNVFWNSAIAMYIRKSPLGSGTT